MLDCTHPRVHFIREYTALHSVSLLQDRKPYNAALYEGAHLRPRKLLRMIAMQLRANYIRKTVVFRAIGVDGPEHGADHAGITARLV
jgi:hypothetical protein